MRSSCVMDPNTGLSWRAGSRPSRSSAARSRRAPSSVLSTSVPYVPPGASGIRTPAGNPP